VRHDDVQRWHRVLQPQLRDLRGAWRAMLAKRVLMNRTSFASRVTDCTDAARTTAEIAD